MLPLVNIIFPFFRITPTIDIEPIFDNNLVHLLQSKDRIHRLGLPDGQYTQYYYFMEKFTCNLGDYSIGEQIYDRLHYKEQIMLDAIENNILEEVTSPEEDLNMIFSSLRL